MAVEFAKVGCNIVLWDINREGLEETKLMLSKSGVKVSFSITLTKAWRVFFWNFVRN